MRATSKAIWISNKHDGIRFQYIHNNNKKNCYYQAKRNKASENKANQKTEVEDNKNGCD